MIVFLHMIVHDSPFHTIVLSPTFDNNIASENMYYCISGNIGDELNVAVWWSGLEMLN